MKNITVPSHYVYVAVPCITSAVPSDAVSQVVHVSHAFTAITACIPGDNCPSYSSADVHSQL